MKIDVVYKLDFIRIPVKVAYRDKRGAKRMRKVHFVHHNKPEDLS